VLRPGFPVQWAAQEKWAGCEAGHSPACNTG